MECDMIAEIAEDTFNCSYLEYIQDFLNTSQHNCPEEVSNQVNARYTLLTCTPNPDLEKFLTIVIIFIVSFIGNIGTIAILSRFKIHKVPDVLVIGLAMTDLLATVIPIPMSMVSYYIGVNYLEGTVLCDMFGVLAHFTRYSSIAIVSLVSLERYFAVNRPFIYRKYATPKRFAVILLFCWLVAFILAVAPAIDPNSTISQHQGYCLFDMSSRYAISILAFAAINYVIVFLCFILVTINLLKVYRRRKKLRVQGHYNQSSKARQRDHPLTFTKPNLTARISDLGKSLKKAAPVITEKFQLGVEAQFARMLFAVVALFYLSWSTLVILVTIAQIRQSEKGLETALFWGIRLSILSTALNPFLYGILARQYRLAYWYVIKLALSKCCYCCVNPPLKDVFAAARNIGGDVRSNGNAGQKHKYGTQRSEVGSDYWSRNSQGVLLTHTTHTLLGSTIPGVYHHGAPANQLQIIPEDFSEHTTNAAEFSTHVPTAGELSSSVTIPQQARDIQDCHQMDMKIRGAASMHDLVDLGLDELGNSDQPMSGAENPLAMITGMVNGKEVIISPLNSDSSDVQSLPPLFSNPLYEMTNSPSNSKTREEIDAEMRKRQQILAASSTDDITLLSKKKSPYSPSRFSDIPAQSVPDDSFGDSSFLKRPTLAHNRFKLGSTPPAHSRSRKTNKASRGGNIPDVATSVQRRKAESSPPPVIRATDIDSGLPVLVPKSSSDASSKTATPTRGVNRVTVHEEVVQPTSNRRPVTVVRTSFDDPPPVTLSQESVDSLREKRRSSIPQPNKADVSVLREKFETGSSSRGVTQNDNLQVSRNSSADSQAKAKTGVKRKNSTENSDSGRESMLDSADNGIPEVPSTAF